MDKKYQIYVNGKAVNVNEEVYKAYWYGHNKEDKFKANDFKNNVLYYDALDTDEMLGSDIITDTKMNIENIIQNKLINQKLHECIGQLTEDEKELVQALYFNEKTMTAYGKEKGISKVAIFKRHQKVLMKLKNLFEE